MTIDSYTASSNSALNNTTPQNTDELTSSHLNHQEGAYESENERTHKKMQDNRVDNMGARKDSMSELSDHEEYISDKLKDKRKNKLSKFRSSMV